MRPAKTYTGKNDPIGNWKLRTLNSNHSKNWYVYIILHSR